MKKLFTFLIVFLSIQLSFAQKISYDKAKKIAVDFFGVTESDSTFLKSGTSPVVDTFKTFYIKEADSLKSANNEQTPAFYIMNRSDKPGFVIVSGDERVRRIIAFSNTKNMRNINPAMRLFFKQYTQEISAIKKADLVVTPTNYDYSDKQYVVGEWLLNGIEWDQNPAPYNTLCPSNCPAGCVAIAMAQIMSYHKYPRRGTGSHSYTSDYGTETADFENTEYEYELMTGVNPESGNTAISTLIYHCGVSVNMDYGPTGSGAGPTAAESAFEDYFDYSSNCDFKDKTLRLWSTWKNMIKAEIDNDNPIYYRAEDSDVGGHAFVLDGYRNDDTYHFNWGWGGDDNDFYPLTLLDPLTLIFLGGTEFDVDHKMITGLVPANPDLIPPTVSITSPINEATLSGNVAVAATATDDGGIAKVEFFIDNDLLCEDDTYPYNCNWNTLAILNNYYVIKAKAYDNSTNFSEDYIGVIVDNTPPEEPHLILANTGNIPSPVSYSGGNYTIQVENSGTGTLSWNTQNIPTWVHISPSNGNVNTSQNVSVTVDPTSTARNAQIKFYNTANTSNYVYLPISQSAPPAATANWEMFQKDYSHTGYQNTDLNTNIGVEWTVNSTTNISTYRGPVVVDNKIIIAGTDAINCYSIDGSLLWTKHSFYANTYPAVYDGVLFVTNDDDDGDGKLYAIDITDGKTIDSSTESAPFEGVITADASGIYVPGEIAYIYAFSWNGSSISLKWYFQSYTQFGEWLEYRDAGVALDGSYVYFNGVTTNDQYLYGVKLNKSTGSYVDHFMITDAALDIDRCNTPVIYNSLIYFSYDVGINGMLDCRYPSTLNRKWNYSSFSDYRITSPVADNSNIYVGDDDGKVYGFNASSGSLLFAEDDGRDIEKGMAIANNCLVVLRTNELDLLSLTDGSEIKEIDLSSSHYAPPAIVGNKIIAFNQDEEIYCISDVFPPVADFIGTPTSGFAPLNVNFTDRSDAGSSSISSWFWDFGDGSTSTLENPSHTYLLPNGLLSKIYTVVLTVNSASGSNTYTRTNYITVGSPPVLSFIPTGHSYSEVMVGSCSENYTFILKNSGGATATGNIELSNSTDFEIVSGGGSFSLGSQLTHEVVARFCPSSGGEKSCNLNTVATAPSNSPSASLSGMGIEPYITIAIPSGGEIWEKGSWYDISWSDNISENVKIELYKNNAPVLEVINSTPSSGNYYWQVSVSLANGGDYKIKVSSIDNESLWGESNTPFTITEPLITPVIEITETVIEFENQIVNTTSSPQSYNISGTNLTENITITAPSGFEISADETTNYSSSLVIPQSGGMVNSAAVYVRFSPILVQPYSGIIAHSSAGAETKNIAVSGDGIEDNVCNPTWTIVTYTNNTTAYCIVTIEGIPAESGDKIGAFVGDECRGIGEITIDNSIAYSNLNIQGESQETVSFKIWDVSECLELDASGTWTTNPGGNIGYPPDYLIVDVGDVTQTVNLNNGWNLKSFYVDVSDKTLPELFGDLSCNITQVKNMSQSWDPAVPDFLNTLSSIMCGEGYFINSQNSCSFDIIGPKCGDVFIDIDNGWNLIGYPQEICQEVTTGIQELLDLSLVVQMKNMTESYDPSVPDFLNTLTHIEPGEGYFLKLNSALSDFSYPESAGCTKSATLLASSGCNWEFTGYEKSTVAYGEITLNNFPVMENAFIGAFVGDECRAVVPLIHHEGKSYASMVINGDKKEEVVFKLCSNGNIYKSETIVVSKPGESFESIIPIKFGITNQMKLGSQLSVNPNPFMSNLEINVRLFESDNIRVNVYGADSRLIRTFLKNNADAGVHNFKWDATDYSGNTCSPGMYFIHFNGNTGNAVEKVILNKQ